MGAGVILRGSSMSAAAAPARPALVRASAGALAPRARAALLPLFLVSAAAVGFENALTRFFAVAKWSQYGYWVISIVMAGFAFAGVAAALFQGPMARAGVWLRALLPAAMVLAAAAGFHFTAANPFNPLALQNLATWAPQAGLIGRYYLCLLPFFFLAGLYISLVFMLNPREIGRVYAYDLIGAGAGAALVLGLMFVLHPFSLAAALLVPLAAAAWLQPGRGRWLGAIAATLALAGGEALLLDGAAPAVNDFKAVYAPLHTPGARLAAEVRSPQGYYQLLDDFTERVDTDVSNDAGLIGLPGPPRSFGLYRDGDRIAALPAPAAPDMRYAAASLSAGPYALGLAPRVLLVGASGGFRVKEALSLGARQVDVVEPEPELRRALVRGLGPSGPLAPDPRVRILAAPAMAVVSAAPPGGYDLIDLSADLLDASDENRTSFTAQALAGDLRALTPAGMVSIPVSIRDFPVYALRVLATARAAMLQAGIADPGAHVLVYRSAWNVRVLVSRTAWDGPRIAALRRFCDRLSFDISYAPGLDVAAARAGLYNDLPRVSFATGQIVSRGPDDAIADEAALVLQGRPAPSARDFNLSPVTLDRPDVHAVLRLSRPDTLLARIEILPQAEIGAVVNLVVLAQAVVIAAAVLALPLLVPGRVRTEAKGRRWALVYFPALGLGFLFLELYLIEKAAFYLNDRTSAFALVLSGMLVFSGLGALMAGRLSAHPRWAVLLAAAVVAAWSAWAFRHGEAFLLSTLSLPWTWRAGLVLAAAAPLAFALGLPFPIGLARVGEGGFLPWAWGLNGAFSVVSTPLANLVARQAGFSRLLVLAAVLYILAALVLLWSRRVLR